MNGGVSIHRVCAYTPRMLGVNVESALGERQEKRENFIDFPSVGARQAPEKTFSCVSYIFMYHLPLISLNLVLR